MIREFIDRINKPVISVVVIIVALANLYLWLTVDHYNDGMAVPVQGDIMAYQPNPEYGSQKPITYSEWKTLLNERSEAEDLQKRINEGRSGSSIENPIVGFTKLEECNDCTSVDSFYQRQHSSPDISYYLLLPGFTLSNGENNVFVSKGEPWIAYRKWQGWQGKADSVDPWNEFAYKKLPARMRMKSEEIGERREISIMIPINASFYKYAAIPWGIIITLAALLLVYFGLFVPIRILIYISKGEIFTAYNESRLLLAARCWLLPPLIIIAIQYINSWLFHGYITDDVELMPIQTLRNYQPFIVGGLVFWAVARAFKRGRMLQEEQSLTI